MEIVSSALKEKNLSVEQLSPELQEQIKGLESMIKKYNEACDEYENIEEEDEETEKELDEMENQIVSIQEEIAEDIRAFNVPETTNTETKKESSGGIGWLLFGGVALVVTLGVVNVFKNK